MTTYGTIPTSSATGTSTSMVDHFKSSLGSLQRWRTMFNYASIGLPNSLGETLTRLRINTVFFCVNYAVIVSVVLFISLLWHPISLIVFVFMMAPYFLLLLRKRPLVLLGHAIDHRLVLALLGLLFLIFLFLTNAKLNILVVLLTGVALVLLHAAVRKTEDLFWDEEATGLMNSDEDSSSEFINPNERL